MFESQFLYMPRLR